MSVGQALIAGDSLMVTLNAHEEFPQELEAVDVNTVVPGKKVELEAGEKIKDIIIKSFAIIFS